MKRIDVHYGGEVYSIGGRDFDELKQEIADGVASGGHWLVVNDGEGHPRPAHLLLTHGTILALVPIPDESGD